MFQHKAADHYLKNEMVVTNLDAHGVVIVSRELLTVTLVPSPHGVVIVSTNLLLP